MNEQIKFYQQIIQTQLSLRDNLKVEHLTNPHITNTIPHLLDNIDEQIRLLNQMITELKGKYT